MTSGLGLRLQLQHAAVTLQCLCRVELHAWLQARQTNTHHVEWLPAVPGGEWSGMTSLTARCAPICFISQ